MRIPPEAVILRKGQEKNRLPSREEASGGLGVVFSGGAKGRRIGGEGLWAGVQIVSVRVVRIVAGLIRGFVMAVVTVLLVQVSGRRFRAAGGGNGGGGKVADGLRVAGLGGIGGLEVEVEVGVLRRRMGGGQGGEGLEDALPCGLSDDVGERRREGGQAVVVISEENRQERERRMAVMVWFRKGARVGAEESIVCVCDTWGVWVCTRGMHQRM